MVQITTNAVRDLAQLSALALDDDEIAALTDDIEHILTYINKLDELDTSEVSSSYQVGGLQNQYRDDVVQPNTVTTEQLLNLAPERSTMTIKVPKVL